VEMLLQPVARTAARARAENFRTLFIVFPLRWTFHEKQFPELGKLAGLHTTHYF
jgi:hypothetical protein